MGEKKVNDFQFGTLTGRSPSDDAAGIVVKGLRYGSERVKIW